MLHTLTAMRTLLVAALASLTHGCSSTDDPEGADITVFDHLAPCSRGEIVDCMIIDEGQGPQYFYDRIEGFTYNWGATYRLAVDIVTIPHPVPDQSSRELHLRDILEVQNAAPRSEFTLALHGEADPALLSLLTRDGQGFTMPFGRTIRCDDAAVCTAISDALGRPAAFELTLRHPDDPTDAQSPLTAIAVVPH